MKLLTTDELKELARQMPDWHFGDGFIEKEFEQKDFSFAAAFTVRVALLAEKADHHPDILIHSWNKVKITLSTHSAGGVTVNDISLAQSINKL